MTCEQEIEQALAADPNIDVDEAYRATYPGVPDLHTWRVKFWEKKAALKAKPEAPKKPDSPKKD